MLRAAARLLLLTLLGCTPHYAKWPYMGPMMCVVNAAPEGVTVVQRDPQGRALPVVRLEPGQRIRFRWAFVASQGQLLAGPWSTDVFEPWSADNWQWVIAGDLTPGACP